MTAAMVTQGEITAAILGAGIAQGSKLLVHSSLSSFGYVDGGAETVIDGLLAAIGAEGALMMPTFNYRAIGVFDPYVTPGATGAISEALRKRPGAVRSLHPTHSVTVLGALSSEFTSGHENTGALRAGSPVDRLAKAGGYTLLLGVRHDSNSAIHVGEAYARPWYLGYPFSPEEPETAWISDRGVKKPVRLAGLQPGCSIAFNAIEGELRARHAITDFKIGKAMCQGIHTQAVLDAAAELIRRREDTFLCTFSGCFHCSNARRRRPPVPPHVSDAGPG